MKALRPFFENHCIEMIPYPWIDESHYLEVEISYDECKKLYYADWHGRKLYWRSGVRPYIIRKNIHALLLEQDARSPHKYVIDNGIDGAVLADIGAAEGCFALDVIDRVKHVYLFECEKGWINALRATFEPWREKVTIVNKFVGDHNDDMVVTLDAYFADKQLDYVKADIEGAEISMIKGGKCVFSNKVKEINVCTYHTPVDADDIQRILTSYGYSCHFTGGYLCIVQGEKPSEWLRRGVVLAKRNV